MLRLELNHILAERMAVMRYTDTLLGVIILLASCATVDPSRTVQEEGALFDASVVETLEPGTSTRSFVLDKMGRPFIDVPLDDGRIQWVYMYTTKKQVLVTFEGDVLDEWSWSEKYGQPIPVKTN
jgi:outer membrane protein assembly factor BamE (lipoprotein component of BamABCDE complex)